jgi:stage III sporulation protein AA
MLPNDILSLFSREARGQLIEHEKNRGPLEEIGVRLLEPLECIVRDGFFELNYIVDDTQFHMILDQLFQSSRYRFTRELQEYFVTLSGGIG